MQSRLLAQSSILNKEVVY